MQHFRDELLEDAQNPESLFRTSVDSALGNSIRAVRGALDKPLQLQPGPSALRDLKNYEAKVGGIRKLVRLEKEVEHRRKAREDAIAAGEAPVNRKKAAEEWIVMMKKAGSNARGTGVRAAESDKPVEPFQRVVHRDVAFRNNKEVQRYFVRGERADFASADELPAIQQLPSPERGIVPDIDRGGKHQIFSGNRRTNRFSYTKVPLHEAIQAAPSGPPRGT